jgi:transcriptional regulator with XRE-family HTH domain
MASSERKTESRFGTLLKSTLSERGMLQSDLAEKLQVSAAYVSAVSTGSKVVSATRVNNISSALNLNDQQRVSLHRAAAQDAGFMLTLPEDF